jgi:Fungal Rad9-like Rad53-binding/BRCA1 C Terminus (BRCT) domain
LSDHSKRSSKYETAETHLSDQTPVARPFDALLASPSGRKRKRLGDIAAQPSPKRINGDSQVDEVMAAMDDSEFYKTIDNVAGSSSPIPPGRNSKRLRLIGRGDFSRRDTSTDSRLPSSPPTSVIDGVLHPIEPAADRDLRTRSKPRHRAEAIWDVQVSPPKSAPTRSTRNGAKGLEKISPRVLNTQRPKSVMRTESTIAETLQNGPDRADEASRTIASGLSEVAPAIQQPDQSSTKVVAPNQVLACFNGNPRGYFPATCIGSTGSRTENTLRYHILWDDASKDNIDEHGIRKLDLHLGDQVKVNLPGWPRISHVIRGFNERVEHEDSEMTDIRGFKTVLLSQKKRKSLPADVSTEQVKEAPISAIYLDTNMWGQMKDRIFTFVPRQGNTSLTLAIPQEAPSRSGLVTPSEHPSTPSTPSSRTRRKSDFPAHSAGTAFPFDAHPTGQGFFSNMVFAISYEHNLRKTSLAKAIAANGGTLLSEDFYDIFVQESSPMTPSRPGTYPCTLTLKARFSNAGFVALITERHSRKPKYMQALALNIPCLSGRWIEACVAAKAIIDWQPYLLSAGESQELEGAVRSRVLPQFEAKSVLVKDMIAMRPNLLQDEAIIIVMGRGKAEEKRKPYVFLAKAAGAGRVEKCVDVKGAKALLEEHAGNAFRWVFVDDKELVKAEATLLSKSKGRQSKEVRVVGNEFLCQSLIMGRVWEQLS